jgi:hypothetical protein
MSHTPDEPELSLPIPSLYFPVSAADGSVHPSRPLGEGGSDAELEVDSELRHYLSYKRALLCSTTTCTAHTPARGPFRSEPVPAEAISRAERYLRARMLQLAFFRNQAARLEQLDLDALILELQEDLVLMVLPAGFAPERARAAYLHVCFPSGWDPAKMLGKSFVSLHGRVPREPGFERADYAGHAASLFESKAERFVWSLTPDAQLDRHPCAYRPVRWSETTQAFLRVERQLNIPLGLVGQDGADAAVAMFLLRTYVYPLARLSAAQRDTLGAALGGMSEAMRRYKGLLGHEARIRELLERA